MIDRLSGVQSVGTEGLMLVDPTKEDVLADRLRWAAESLTLEFKGVSPADAERLIFDVAREFSNAKVAQFVPTFASRRARQMLRDRQTVGSPAEAAPDDLEVIIEDAPITVETSPVAEAPSAASARLQPPAYYAIEAKRLLERAKVLRATTDKLARR